MNSESVISNLFWRFAERCGAQGVSFVVSIVLARLLAPEDYGLIALVTVFTSILQVFVDSGLATSLIQKKDADDVDFSSVFYFNVCFCFLLYMMLFIAAPYIAAFYGKPQLTRVVQVLGLRIIISGLKNVQQAYVSKHMMFRKFFWATLAGTIAAGFIGITFAYLGFGVWALVIQGLVNSTMDTLILWCTVKWHPKRCFSFSRLKSLLSFGFKMLISCLISTVYNELRQLIIGKMYSASDLAFYNKGKQLPNMVITNINTSIDSVLLPAMSKEQDDSAHIKEMTRKAMSISIYVMAPIFIGLMFCATPIIELLLTEKWLPCVPFLRIFCITYMFQPVHTANLNAIKAMGRSDLFLKLEIIKKIVGMILLVVSMNYGVMAMAYSLLVSSLLSQIINSWPNRKLLNYGYLDQMKDILPSILTALVMGIVVFFIGYANLPTFPLLIIQIICGVVIYMFGSSILKLEPYKYVKGMALSYVRKKGSGRS